MEFLMPETKVYAILTAGYDRKERMEGRILGEEHAMAGSFFLRKREKRYILERPCFLYNKAIKFKMHIPQELRIRSRGTERHSASN
ncbi:hypothetical protein GPK70_10695 [Fusicatenibacter saccharivorans]|uniref:hypothetical protein n=1 Tax=Fusicatenibacter saccharivorans TaxID=1150298 RepID=UPI001C00C8D5|nr:hypothetical protein [Fusicatenibacter saccharivorans]MBT9688098.1 hypothetical protein [Fusicatenibacter saccharivorans]